MKRWMLKIGGGFQLINLSILLALAGIYFFREIRVSGMQVMIFIYAILNVASVVMIVYDYYQEKIKGDL